ncbi:MAG: hypothetical protein HN929_12905 [Chloroflexi bacterium]|jgi:hypothetical protein|nr:hypothetical protein [Chloroflexota bacterium]
MARANYIPELAITEPGSVVTDLRAYTTIALAIADISTTPSTLLISRDETVAAGTTTIPSTTTVMFTRGSVLTVPTGAALVVNGNIDAPLNQIFNRTGTGTITLRKGALTRVYPQYFGALGDGSNDDTTAIEDAVATVIVRGGTVWFPTGTYLITSSIVIDTDTNQVPVVLRGEEPGTAGTDSGSLIEGSFAGYLVDFHSTGSIGLRCGVRDLGFSGTAQALTQHGVRIGYVRQGFVENCAFQYFDNGIAVGVTGGGTGMAAGTYIKKVNFLDTNICINLINFIETTASDIQGSIHGNVPTNRTATIYADPAAADAYDTLKLNNIWDFSSREYGIYVEINTGAAGSAGRNHLGEWNNCIFETQTIAGIYVDAPVANMFGRLAINNYYGVHVDINNVTNVRITNSQMPAADFNNCEGIKTLGNAWNANDPAQEATGVEQIYGISIGVDSTGGNTAHRRSVANAQYTEIAFPRSTLLVSRTNTQNTMALAANATMGADSAWDAINTEKVAILAVDDGNIYFQTAPSTTAGALPALIDSLYISNTGALSLYQNSVSLGTGTELGQGTTMTLVATTAGSQTGVLENGTRIGQLKIIAYQTGAHGFVLTPAIANGWTNITFTANGQGCTMVWTTAGWICVSSQGGTVS